jgi:hypothetical protein
MARCPARAWGGRWPRWGQRTCSIAYVAAFDPGVWEPFAIALLGAAAVLVGLIFVGLSINLERLLRAPWLFRRAGGAIVQLAAVLVAAALLLVPSQATVVLGMELMLLGMVSVALLTALMLRGRMEIAERYRRRSDEAMAMGLVAVLLYAIAGVTLAAGTGGGLYWLVPAMLLCICRALLDSWVLLVEINR